MLSIIIPTYNEVENIGATIKNITAHAGDEIYEIIIADGGSDDQTINMVMPLGCKVVQSKKGRGNQLNAGVKAAQGQSLLFLHADTLLPKDFIHHINLALKNEYLWGRFDVRLSGKHFLFRIIEKMISLRSRLTGIATGDQAIFVNKTLFNQVEGFRNIPLMEDIEITHRFKQISPPACLSEHVITSSRRWEKNGIIKTVILMWTLRFLYYIGVNPVTLQKLY